MWTSDRRKTRQAGESWGGWGEVTLEGDPAGAYLDGERPYLIACRGYYTRATLAAYDFFENRFHKVWGIDSGFVPMARRLPPTLTSALVRPRASAARQTISTA